MCMELMFFDFCYKSRKEDRRYWARLAAPVVANGESSFEVAVNDDEDDDEVSWELSWAVMMMMMVMMKKDEEEKKEEEGKSLH